MHKYVQMLTIINKILNRQIRMYLITIFRLTLLNRNFCNKREKYQTLLFYLCWYHVTETMYMVMLQLCCRNKNRSVKPENWPSIASNSCQDYYLTNYGQT